MNKKIGLYIGGRRFDVEAQEDFVPFLEDQMSNDFNIDGNNDVKEIFSAYVRKTHKLYMQEKKAKDIIKELDKSI